MTPQIDEMAVALRAALQSTTGIAEVDRSSSLSLLYGIVGDDPDLLQVWYEEVGPEQVELDLYLGGEGVDGHTTNAQRFGTFISKISESVKETAKEIAGRRAYSHELLVEGAMPGSVRVVLKAPEHLDDSQHPHTATSSVDSQALRRIAQVVTIASDNDELEDDALDAAVQQLPISARRALGSAVDTARSAGWEVEGSIAERRRGYDQVRLTSRGAAKLSTVLRAAQEKHTTEESFGFIDGLKYSLGVMWFAPETGGRPFAAAVPDDAELSHVAVLAANHELRVRAVFDAYESIADGRESVIKRSRVLRSIEPAPEHEQPSLPAI